MRTILCRLNTIEERSITGDVGVFLGHHRVHMGERRESMVDSEEEEDIPVGGGL